MSSQRNPEPTRLLPVRPNLDQLKNQAKDLLRAARRGEPEALAEFNAFHPAGLQQPGEIKLADAQLTLARSYGAPNWPRLVQSCKLIDAIWRDDIEAVRDLVTKHPNLIHENARIRNDNWGPPLSYAANVGRNEIIKLLYDLGARDLERAVDLALLQSKIDTARLLHELMGSPPLPDGALAGTAYTLSATGTQLAFELGARLFDENGKSLAPVDVVLETDSRKPAAKHQILELYVQHGLKLPDTPVMALHRGRLDLLEEHLRRDPQLLSRTFTHEEIYPPELNCHDEVLATQGTPLAGTTLLHLCADYDEIEIARWLLEQGMNPNTRATVDADGFGGHTALFNTVVSQPNFWMNYTQQPPQAHFTELLLDYGADPSIRASLRKKLHPGYGRRYDVENTYEYRNVTALEWGREFHAKVFVSEPALKLLMGHGRHRRTRIGSA
jgi:ankyrin repeat protein